MHLMRLVRLSVSSATGTGPLFRKSIVQIRNTVLTFGLRLRLGLGLGQP